jgi:hypothetical protein
VEASQPYNQVSAGQVRASQHWKEHEMTDRELLELAAKAGGLVGTYVEYYDGGYYYSGNTEGIRYQTADGNSHVWNPLTDDGDALRLAVKLRLDICRPESAHEFVCVWVDHLGDFIEEPHGTDPYAATRRAIVRAAAEIGRAMK